MLRLQGEVRTELVSRLHDAAADLRARGARHLLLDLGDVAFIDSASVGEMLRLDADHAAGGGRLVLYGLPRIVQRVLELTGLSTRLRIARDEAAARALLR